MIRSSSERNLKGFAIANLYYYFDDYDKVCRYLAKYLEEEGTSAAAHKLNSQIFEKLKQPGTALECFIRAYEIKPSNDLVLKICGVLTELPIDWVRHWVEAGARSIPHSDVVCKLTEPLSLLVKEKTALL